MSADRTPPVKPDDFQLKLALSALRHHLGDFQTAPSGPKSNRVTFAIQLIMDELAGEPPGPRDRLAATARFCLTAAKHGLDSLAQISPAEHEKNHVAAAVELVDAALETMDQPMAALWPSLDSEQGRKRCMAFGGYEIARQALEEWKELGPAGAKDWLEYQISKGGRS